MAAEIREYKGIKYIHADYTGILYIDEMLAILDTGLSLYRENPGINKVLSNFTDAFITKEFVEKIIHEGKEQHARIALVGVTGIKSIIVNTINAATMFDSRVFKYESDALEWLIS